VGVVKAFAESSVASAAAAGCGAERPSIPKKGTLAAVSA
jgi:hypothetical protein